MNKPPSENGTGCSGPPFVVHAADGSLELALSGEGMTLKLGRALGGLLRPGDVVLLAGELGAGKTVLARGLALGLDVPGDYAVVSPTFTLLNVYPGRVELFHADLYRIKNGEIADLMLLEEAAEGVLAVEWPDNSPEPWPADSARVELFRKEPGKRSAKLTWADQRLGRLGRLLSGLK